MLYHYLKVAYRILVKNNIYSLISVFGLAIALSLTFIIVGFILFQLSFDKYHKNYRQVYRVNSINKEYSNSITSESPFILASALRNNFPEVKEAARIVNLPFQIGPVIIQKENEFIEELEFYCADQELFSILDIPLISKSTSQLLSDPYNIVLSESMAYKYFDRDNRLGKILVISTLGKTFELKVSGIMYDFPKNSSIKADFFCSTNLYIELITKYIPDHEVFTKSWDKNFFSTYLLFRENMDVDKFESKLNDALTSLYEVKNIQYQLQNLGDIHFNSSNIKGDLYIIKGNIQQVYLFAGIVIVILFIAVINYIILTTARSSLRYKEIGLKKVFGVNKTGLIVQLMIESLLVSFISFIICIILLFIIKNHTHLILFNDLDFALLWNWKIFIVFLAITIFTGIFSGFYISIQVAAFNPIDTIKNIVSVKQSKFDIKIVLIIFQLTSFIILTIFSIFIYKQVRFAINSDLGFSKEDLIIVRFDPNEFNDYQNYKNSIKQNPNIVSVSGAFIMPPANARSNSKFARADDPSVEVVFENYNIDYGFFKTLGINIIEGREYDEKNSTDLEQSTIINKKAVTEFGINNPIGKKIGGRKIIGVVDNIYVHSFHHDLSPAIFSLHPYACQHIAIKTAHGQTEQVLDFLEEQWRNIAPNIPFNFYFIDNELEQFYRKDRQFGQSINLYTLIAIFISILGLFGLSLFMSDRKTKEITIRKVHGASKLDIIYMLTKQFLKYALIANLISLPIAYYLVDNWLQNFSIRLSLLDNWWVFLIAGVLSISIIICTVGFKAWQTARLNPVDNLKYE